MPNPGAQTQSAMEPPPGAKPDFVHPSSLERFILPTQIIIFALIAICVLVRMYTCIFVIRRFGVEECMRQNLCSLKVSLICIRHLPGLMGRLTRVNSEFQEKLLITDPSHLPLRFQLLSLKVRLALPHRTIRILKSICSSCGPRRWNSSMGCARERNGFIPQGKP